MRLVITSVAVVLALVALFVNAYYNFWLRNLGALSVIILWYFAVLQPPKNSSF